MDRFNVRDAAELFFKGKDYDDVNDGNNDEKTQYLQAQMREMLYNVAKILGRPKC